MRRIRRKKKEKTRRREREEGRLHVCVGVEPAAAQHDQVPEKVRALNLRIFFVLFLACFGLFRLLYFLCANCQDLSEREKRRRKEMKFH